MSRMKVKTNLPQDLSQLSSIADPLHDVFNWSGAVVFLKVEDSLLLIRRSDTMPTHKGQVGFVGGHKNDGEDHPFITAQREFTEETGISKDMIEVKGLLDPVMTSKRRLIIPVYAEYKDSISHLLQTANSNGEWDNMMAVPLNALSRIESWSVARLKHTTQDYLMYFFAMDKSYTTYQLNVDESYMLWGASAKMIVNFFQKHLLDDKN